MFYNPRGTTMKLLGAILMGILSSATQALDAQAMQTLTAYAQGTEYQDMAMLEGAFHKDFRVVAMTADGLRVIDRDSYLALIKAKKIGGHKRTLNIKQVIEGDKLIQVSLTLRGENAIFHDHLDLIKQDSAWQILHNSTQIEATNP